MDDYGNGMGGWSYPLMIVAIVLFLGLLAVGIIMLFRQQGGSSRQPSNPPPFENTPERILAERFGRGEIDDEEYRRRVGILREHTKP